MTTPSETLFDSKIERAFLGFYRRAFSIAEIEGARILQWVFGATAFSYFLVFNSWVSSRAMTADAFVSGRHSCWPYFQSCGEWLFLRALPEGYSQTFLYMMLFGTLLLAAYLMYRRDWILAHLMLVPSFLWHALGSFVFTQALAGNYDYYLFLFGLVLLFLPHKEYFLKLLVVLLYFLSTATKIHPTWIVGTYFSALETGLPLFPDWSIPLWTNVVIGMEMVGAWFLFSRMPLLQRGALAFFIAFHLYSGLLVEYRYPATVLPTLIILFGPMYRHTPIPLDRKAIAGWILIGLLLLLQMSSFLIPGDEKLTMEGNRYGLYMFESNHQCISSGRVVYDDGTREERKRESNSARARCDPYRYWFSLNTICNRNSNIASISWTFDHSINGDPFLRIVDVPDACELTYRPFARNEWIKSHHDNPEIVGYPVENIYE